MDINSTKDLLKKNIKMKDVLKSLGISADSKKIRCFIHDDKNPSMSIYNDRVHCHACQFDEDIIGVVSKVLNLSFVDSIRWILSHFMPGIPLDNKFNYEVKNRITMQRNVREGLKKWRNKAHDCLCLLYRESQKSKKLSPNSVGFFAACELEGPLESLVDALGSDDELQWLQVYRVIGEGWRI